MSEWRLTNFSRALGWEPDESGTLPGHETVAVESEGALREELARLRRGSPALLYLWGSPAGSLSIGLGPELSALCWREPSPGLGSRRAFIPRPLTDQTLVCWDSGGGADFLPQYQLPTDEVIEAVVSYYRHQELPDTIQWLYRS
jgi:hypothetical protein